MGRYMKKFENHCTRSSGKTLGVAPLFGSKNVSSQRNS